jgi:hypothetical protein
MIEPREDLRRVFFAALPSRCLHCQCQTFDVRVEDNRRILKYECVGCGIDLLAMALARVVPS